MKRIKNINEINKTMKEKLKQLEKDIEQQNELISILWEYVWERDYDEISRRVRKLESEKNNK